MNETTYVLRFSCRSIAIEGTITVSLVDAKSPMWKAILDGLLKLGFVVVKQ